MHLICSPHVAGARAKQYVVPRFQNSGLHVPIARVGKYRGILHRRFECRENDFFAYVRST
jgi:hypothetical protein